MSYHCQKCDAIHEGSELKVITKIRNVDYERYILKFDKASRESKPQFDIVTKGWEPVEILRVCNECNKDNVTPVVTETKTVKYNYKRKKLAAPVVSKRVEEPDKKFEFFSNEE